MKELTKTPYEEAMGEIEFLLRKIANYEKQVATLTVALSRIHTMAVSAIGESTEIRLEN